MSYRFLWQSQGRARKTHRCTWCGEDIVPGTEYLRRRGVFEGDPQVDKFHLECEVAASEHFVNDEGFEPFINERPTASDEGGKSASEAEND